MGIKKVYYSVENKWYDFVEKTGLYKVTDKIDKFMPSLIFVILLIIMIIAGIFLLLPMTKGTGDIELTFKVLNDQDEPVPLAPVLIVTSEEENSRNITLKTNENGVTSKIRLPYNTTYLVEIDYPGSNYESYSGRFIAEESEEKRILLDSIPEEITTTYYFTLVDSETKMKINEAGEIEFACNNSNVLPPDAFSFMSGDLEVTVNSDCQLRAKSILIDGYVARNDIAITHNMPPIDFQPLEDTFDFAETYFVYVSVQGEAGDPLTGMRAELYSNGVPVYGKNCTTISGVCTISGVDADSYVLKVTDNRGVQEYGLVEKSIFVSSNTSETITMTRTIAGYIQVKVKKTNNQAIEGAEVKLKHGDTTISSGHFTSSNGIVTVPVYDLAKTYRVVASKEGYLVNSASDVTAEVDPKNPTVTITLQQITPQTAATVNIKVVDSYFPDKGFSHAQVVLYDSSTGFLTDYDSKITNSEGKCTFRVTPGVYYAKAFRGASEGVSEEFEVVIDSSTEDINVTVPIEVVRTSLNIIVVNNYGEPVPRANILVFDKYNSRKTVWGGDLTNIEGTYLIPDLVSDSEVYVVISDIVDNLGTTQSEYVYLKSNVPNELKVTLYPKQTSLEKPEIKFLGFFNDAGEKLNGYLRSGAEYKARFLLLIPQDRDGRDRFDEVGSVIRTGSISSVASPYMENDSLYIKSINLPNAEVTKYTQYSSEDGYDGIDDVDTLTEGDSKWAKILFNPIYGTNYANAYTIMATIKIKDTAVYGEEVAINYLGYGYTKNNRYEIDPIDDTSSNYIEYKTHKIENFNIGEEQACSNDFCFNLNIINLDEDLREDVSDYYNAAPNQNYKLRFGLINNDSEKLYNINSRIVIKNQDKGLKFSNIKITQPNGQVLTQTTSDNIYEYNIPITQFNPHTKILGEIDFTPVLKGDRIFNLIFISDQKIIFTKQVAIHVISDKTFAVKITPKTIPSGKNFNLQVEVKDATTNIEVDKVVHVKVKDRFKKDLLANPVQVGALGIASVNNIPGQEPNNRVYVYVEAPEYETSITELKVTDEVFDITPTRLGVSLNINTKKTETAKFTIENLSENDLVIDSITFMGNDNQIDVIDVQRVNNSLLGFIGTEIPGVDSSERPGADNYNNKKEIEVDFFTSPRASTITSTRNIGSKLVIRLRDKHNDAYVWATELPVTLAVSYEGLMDDSHCITLSEELWETTVVDKYVEKQFTLKNNCGVNSTPVPLNGGLAAKVEFEGSSPLGVFTLNVGSRLVELSHGYFKNIYDSVDAEKQHNVVLKYSPVGRFTGDIKGKIIFRSINETGINSGAQELISEYKFILHVISLNDCYSVSKKVLTAKDTGEPDSFVIENKGCGSEITYRLSCDDCPGLILNPKEDIVVPATGTSENIEVKSIGAMPGIYLVNIFSKVSNVRGSERNIGKVRVEVRPTTQCIDLDRYEYDLYRYEYFEGSGIPATAKSYDTGNIINRCYGQDVNVQGKMKSNGDVWRLALYNGIRDGIFTAGASALVKKSKESVEETGTGLLGNLWNKFTDLFKKKLSKLTPKERIQRFGEELDSIFEKLNKIKTDKDNMAEYIPIEDRPDYLKDLQKKLKKQEAEYNKLKKAYSKFEAYNDIGNQKKINLIDSLISEIEKSLENPKATEKPSIVQPSKPEKPKIEIKNNIITITSVDKGIVLFYSVKYVTEKNPEYRDNGWQEYTSQLNKNSIIKEKAITIYAIACKQGLDKNSENCSEIVSEIINASATSEANNDVSKEVDQLHKDIDDLKHALAKLNKRYEQGCGLIDTLSTQLSQLKNKRIKTQEELNQAKELIQDITTQKQDYEANPSSVTGCVLRQENTKFPVVAVTGDSCNKIPELNVGDWACVCMDTKNVVAAKCTESFGLSAYGKEDCKRDSACKNATAKNTGKSALKCYDIPKNTRCEK